jgi:hypothetical protein
MDIVEETNSATTLTYHDMSTRVNQKFRERNIDQAARFYCSAEEAQELFLR